MALTRTSTARYALIDRSGRVLRFSSLYRLADKLVGRHSDTPLAQLVSDLPGGGPYRVRNGGGLIDGWHLAYLVSRRGSPAAVHAAERGEHRAGPWPRTARKRRHRGACFRRVATKACLTAQALADPDLMEIGLAEKSGRRRALPTYYDDVHRQRQRCWKRHRATQYR